MTLRVERGFGCWLFRGGLGPVNLIVHRHCYTGRFRERLHSWAITLNVAPAQRIFVGSDPLWWKMERLRRYFARNPAKREILRSILSSLADPKES